MIWLNMKCSAQPDTTADRKKRCQFLLRLAFATVSGSCSDFLAAAELNVVLQNLERDAMEIPKENQYEYLTGHLQYLNEKIIQFFTLFIKLATAIVGGAFYLHLKLPPEDVKRASISNATDFLFILVSFSMILLILNNLRSWFEFRNTLSEQYPEIANKKHIMRWLTEAVMCLVIVITCIGFLAFSPL